MPPTEPAFQTFAEVAKIKENMAAAQEYTRNDMLRLGFLKPEDLDDEEIAYGCAREYDEDPNVPLYKHIARRQRRGGNKRRTNALSSTQTSNQAQQLPLEIYTAIQQEHTRRANQYLRANVNEALNVITDIMGDETCEPRDRMDAAKYIIERVHGKTPEKVNVTVEKAPWEEVFTDLATVTRQVSRNLRTAQDNAQPGNTIDAEVVPLGEAMPVPRQYGYIQKPVDIDGDPIPAEGPDNSERVRDTPDFADTTHPPQPNYQRPTAAPSHEEQPTVPRDQFDPRLHPYTQGLPTYSAPTYRNPRDTSSTAPNPYDHQPIQGQDQYAEPAVPLSGYLREQQAYAEQIAKGRKDRADAQKAAKKARQEARPERNKAMVSRIIKRAMGTDALGNSPLIATEVPIDDETSQVKFSDPGND